MSVYLSVRGQGPERKAHVCETMRGLEVQILPNEAEQMIVDLMRFLLPPDSRLPFQVRAMVRREQTKNPQGGAR